MIYKEPVPSSTDEPSTSGYVGDSSHKVEVNEEDDDEERQAQHQMEKKEEEGLSSALSGVEGTLSKNTLALFEERRKKKRSYHPTHFTHCSVC